MKTLTESTNQGRHIVDYKLSLENMISKGKYDLSFWVPFKICGSRRVEFEEKIFRFFHTVSSSDEVVAQITGYDPKNPWEPAKVENILFFGANNPEIQRRLTIIALGSVGESHGRPVVAFLSRDGYRRELGVLYLSNIWTDCDYCFLAVRRVKKNYIYWRRRFGSFLHRLVARLTPQTAHSC